jgi:TrpR-related protein YerC/YecD
MPSRKNFCKTAKKSLPEQFRMLICIKGSAKVNSEEKVACRMNKKIKNELTDKLFECILTMETIEDCYRLFEDLCTVNEIQAIAQRMEVAAMLDAKCTYVEIAEKTGASTATISRVNRCLNYGTDGYKLAIERVKEKRAKQ